MENRKGAFVGALIRNNEKIRTDRALSIVEIAEVTYKREVEDIGLRIKEVKRDRDGMLDLSPTDSTSLMVATDFDPKGFVSKDIELGVKIRNLEIMQEIAQKRYNELFQG